jgi:hypothetical protein
MSQSGVKRFYEQIRGERLHGFAAISPPARFGSRPSVGSAVVVAGISLRTLLVVPGIKILLRG